MANRDTARGVRRVMALALIAAIAVAGLAAPPARAQQAGGLQQLDTALKLVPADAAFYSSTLRGREQIEAIANSRAWEKITQMPVIQMGLMLYQLQAAGKIDAALEDPENRQLLEMAGDMLSHEVFFYGDESFIDGVQLMQEVAASTRYGPLVLQLTGKAEGVDGNKLQAMLALAALSENAERIKVPSVVLGFKLSDTARAGEQLARLEKAAAALENDPQMKGRFQKTEIGGHPYLTLSLDGGMVPWDEVPMDEFRQFGANQGDLEKVIARLKQLTLVVALGVRDDYLLLSIGPSTDCLSRLGKGERLVDRPELRPLEKFAGKRLVSIAYVSKAINQRIATGRGDIDQLVATVNEVLPHAKLKPEQKDQIRKDAAALAEDLKKMIPDAGAVMAFSFLADQGIEGYQYNWSGHAALDGSKPLGILRHLGGNPLMAVAGRGKHSPQDYDFLVKWLKIAYGYVEQYALPQMDDADREDFEKFVKLASPLLKRIDRANRTMLIPALADGQAALVVDRKLQSKQFHVALPESDEPLPMIEPAIVVGVSDAELMQKAMEAYWAVLQDLVGVIRQMEPGAIPDDYMIPEPEVTEESVGKIYGWSLPEDWGLERKIVPNIGLSEKVAAVSVSREHTQRLLGTAPLAVGGVLTETGRPLAAAAVFDWAGLVDVATPWVDLLMAKIGGNGDGLDPAVVDQVHTVLEVLKVLRTITSETYVEGDALVTHTLTEIRDVED